MNFKEAREEAFARLKEDRHRATFEEVAQIHGIMLAYASPAGIRQQVRSDLRVYPFYDALAMWLDEEDGLVADVPEMMSMIAKAFLEVIDA